MNNRYLYRAKRNNWRELPKEMWWIEGYYAYFKQNDNHCIYYETDGFTLVCDIDISTICACTGLKDKNGKLIWENDIVCVKHTDGQEEYQENAKVSYTKRGFSPFSWEYYCDGCDVRCEILEVEVIGSAIDNPELLEVGE